MKPALFSGLFALLSIMNLSAKEIEAYVYVEPFELRFEMVVPANQLTPPSNNEIPQSLRQQLLERWTAELRAAAEIQADGAIVDFEADSVEFVREAPKGVVPDDREVIPIEEALVGIVFVSSRNRFPREIKLTWKFFPLIGDALTTVKCEAAGASDQFQKELTFSKEDRVQDWQLPKLQNPWLKSNAVGTDANWKMTALWGIVFLLLACLFWLLGIKFPSFQRGAIILAGLCAFVVMIAVFLVRIDYRNAADAAKVGDEDIVHILLDNVYHAFDFRQEARIYDTLATSVEGDLLEQLYLEIREGLAVEEEGGPRVRITRVRLNECSAQRSGEQIEAEVDWTAFGNVSHFGHEHARRNGYRAQLTIEPRNGVWKIVKIDILEETRD